MKHCFRAESICAAAMLTVMVGVGELEAQPVFEEEVSSDGLYRVDPAILDNAWLHPEADLSRYSYVFVLPAVVLFRDLPPPSHSAWVDQGRTTFPVDEKMQQRLRDTFGESFHNAVKSSRDFDVSDRLGRDVLLVRGYLTDVATGMPPQNLAGSNTAAIRWIWEGNLAIELRDSMSDMVLLRIYARQRVEGPVEAERVWSLAPRVTRQWSRILLDQLATVSDFYPSRLQRMQERAEGALD